jgi:hypothetical protein
MNGMGGGRSMGMGGGGMGGAGMSTGMSFTMKKQSFGQGYPGSQKWGGMSGKMSYGGQSRGGQRGSRPSRGGRR